jgi:excisionase family DNA binding protein
MSSNAEVAQHPEPVAVRRSTAATMLDCSATTIHKLIHQGKLEVIKIGADQRVTVASIRRLAAGEQQA